MGRTFDKDAWLEGKQQKLDDAKAALTAGLAALKTSEDWQRTLAALSTPGPMSVLRYSFTNNLLIHSARPGTRHAGTFASWQRYGRNVRKGEKAMAILAPVFSRKATDDSADSSPGPESLERHGAQGKKVLGFKTVAVFALEQTEGEPFARPQLPDITSPEVFESSVERLQEVVLALPGMPVVKVDVRERAEGDNASANGWFVPTTRGIVVISSERSRAQQFRTLCHEAAHAILHPLGDRHAAPERELEAESTAFVVCHALGLDTGTYSFPYVGTWAGGENAVELVAQSGERITRTARTLLDALLGTADREAAAAA